MGSLWIGGEHMQHERITRIIKITLILLVTGAVAALCVRYLIPLSRMLVTEQGREEIYRAVQSYGIYAPLVFAGLMALQIVIAFIPGGALELIAGMLFGGMRGTVFSMLGAVVGTTLVYFLVKQFGRPLVHVFISENKIRRFSILNDERRLEFWVFLLFLIPGIPKDLLTYIVPLTKMRPLRFIVLSNLARLPAIAASVFMGDSISEGRYWLCITIAGVFVLAAFIGFYVKTHVINNKGERS